MIQNLIDKLENSYIFDKRHNNVLAVIEAAFALVAGGFIGSVIAKYDTSDLVLGLIFAALFLYLFFRRISKENNFSVSALGELKSTIELRDKTREVERKNIIDNYIDDAVKALNSNTCNYNNVNIENHLCDQSLENGLKSVYQPFFSNPQNLLDTPKAKFTVGAFINYFYKMPSEFTIEPCFPLGDHNIFIPRDDLNFSQYFVKDQLTDPHLHDLPFFFQTQFLDTSKHNRFINQVLNLTDQKEYTVITAPIPTVCEDGTTGIFFIISERLNGIPSDFENLCQIFGRLFSNWLSKYNDCIHSRCMQANSQLKQKGVPAVEPPEVIKLKEERQHNAR